MKKSYAGIVILAVIVAAAIFWEMSGAPLDAPDNDQPSVAVSTITLAPGSLPATVAAYGSIGAGAGAEESVSIGAGGISDPAGILSAGFSGWTQV